MQAVVDFVERYPGTTMRGAIMHVLETMPEMQRARPGAYKQAAAAVERVIKDRHVRQEGDRLHPWDPKRRAFAEALERAASVAPDPAHKVSTRQLACAAWREAGDENRARILERNALEKAS